MMWFLFKGMLISICLFFFQMVNGFSGTTFIEDYYYAMYEVIMTTFAIYFYLLLDQDVPFQDRFSREPLRLYPLRMANYLKKKLKRFVSYSLYAWAGSIFIFFLSFYTLSEAVNSSGKTLGMWAGGLVCLVCIVGTHHGMIAVGTRNFTWAVIVGYLFSFSCLFITMSLNEYTPGTSTYRSTFPDMLGGTWLFWLTTGVGISALVLPFAAIRSWEGVIING
mmetsp:Transcript_32846/g.50198  ORF Transcript_32846/g.50198 Transcript_32846/m.50198 type:complete len:221 (+) Transcript_32846:2426-3088(+)